MTIAVPLFGLRVSPRFDCAPDMMLVTVDGGEITSRQRFSMGQINSLARINWICQRGVDVVVCGGITRFSMRSLTNRGLQVFPWVTGDAEEIIEMFLSGRLRSGLVVEAGKRQRRWRCRGRRGNAPWVMD